MKKPIIYRKDDGNFIAYPKNFHIVKVVSRNFLMDIVAKIENLFGGNLKPYEKMIDKGIEQIQSELIMKGIKPQWYRIETTFLSNGAVMLMMYGEEK